MIILPFPFTCAFSRVAYSMRQWLGDAVFSISPTPLERWGDHPHGHFKKSVPMVVRRASQS